MTTPKPEVTMPAIAEALADRFERWLDYADAEGIQIGAHGLSPQEVRVILVALRADPMAGDRGSGAPLTGTGPREPSPEVSASGFDPSRMLPRGFENRIVSERHSFLPETVIVGWGFRDRDEGLKQIAHVAALARIGASATEAEGRNTEGGSVHEGAAGNAGTPDPSPLHPHAEGNGHG